MIPVALTCDLRADGRQPPPGLGDLRGDGDRCSSPASSSSTSPSSTGRPPSTPPACTRAAFDGSTGGNLEGKEQRFGIANSALWSAVTTVTSCGAVNAAFESLTGIGGLVPFVEPVAVGETIFGGVGTGLYSMLLFVLLAVFIGGLMVGRTPEYLGKKIEAREIKLVALGPLFTPLPCSSPARWRSRRSTARRRSSPRARRASRETLYAYISQANNNGSAFAGYTGFVQPEPGNLGAHGITFADLLGGLTMLGARFVPIARSCSPSPARSSRKRVAPAGLGTLRTDTPTFVGAARRRPSSLVGALTFFPALLLGPSSRA